MNKYSFVWYYIFPLKGFIKSWASYFLALCNRRSTTRSRTVEAEKGREKQTKSFFLKFAKEERTYPKTNIRMKSAVVISMLVFFGTTSFLQTVSAKSLRRNGEAFLREVFNNERQRLQQEERKNELNDLDQFQDGFKRFLQSRDSGVKNLRRQNEVDTRLPCVTTFCPEGDETFNSAYWTISKRTLGKYGFKL